MNHKDTKNTEKKKKRNVSHWRYLRFLTIPVMIFLVVSCSLIIIWFTYNLQQYNHNRRLWDNANPEGAIFSYVFGYADGSIHLSGHWANSVDLWDMAFDCVKDVICTIRYDEQYHYPEYIYPKYNEMLGIGESIQVERPLFCSDEKNHQICEVYLSNNQSPTTKD